MGQVIETRINNFSGGISNDPRDSRPNVSRVLTNFDVSTYLHKLVPYRQSESGDSNASTSRKQNFAVARRDGTTYSLFGLGVVSGTDRPEVEYMDLDANLNSDTWGANPPNNAGGANYDATDEWTVSAFTVPAHFVITSLCEWGNLLAIGCAARNGVGNSKVFFWNMDTANTLPTESIDWGTGSLMILEDVDGELIGISQKGGASSSFATIPNLDSAHKDRVIFRRLVGNRAVKFHQLSADRAGGINTTSLPIYKQKVDNRLYFQMIIQYNG